MHGHRSSTLNWRYGAREQAARGLRPGNEGKLSGDQADGEVEIRRERLAAVETREYGFSHVWKGEFDNSALYLDHSSTLRLLCSSLLAIKGSTLEDPVKVPVVFLQWRMIKLSNVEVRRFVPSPSAPNDCKRLRYSRMTERDESAELRCLQKYFPNLTGCYLLE